MSARQALQARRRERRQSRSLVKHERAEQLADAIRVPAQRALVMGGALATAADVQAAWASVRAANGRRAK